MIDVSSPSGRKGVYSAIFIVPFVFYFLCFMSQYFIQVISCRVLRISDVQSYFIGMFTCIILLAYFFICYLGKDILETIFKNQVIIIYFLVTFFYGLHKLYKIIK